MFEGTTQNIVGCQLQVGYLGGLGIEASGRDRKIFIKSDSGEERELWAHPSDEVCVVIADAFDIDLSAIGCVEFGGEPVDDGDTIDDHSIEVLFYHLICRCKLKPYAACF